MVIKPSKQEALVQIIAAPPPESCVKTQSLIAYTVKYAFQKRNQLASNHH